MYDTASPFIASYLIFRQANKVAFILRQNTTWMNGHYALPAGKVEKNESFIACAIREAQEETGVQITADNLKPVLTVHRHSDNTDWVDQVFEVVAWQGELRNAEPEIHGELSWFDQDNLPENTVPNSQFIIEQVQKGQTYAEYGWD